MNRDTVWTCALSATLLVVLTACAGAPGRNGVYLGQETVTAPGMPMAETHAMSEGSMRVPTRLPDGSWLPQGHPDARRASMEELMTPLLPRGRPETDPAHEHGARGGGRR